MNLSCPNSWKNSWLWMRHILQSHHRMVCSEEDRHTLEGAGTTSKVVDRGANIKLINDAFGREVAQFPKDPNDTVIMIIMIKYLVRLLLSSKR